MPDLADAYLQAGVRFLQLRAKAAPSRDVLAWADAVARRADAGVWLVVNDRVDIALAAGLRHVHVGQDDLPVNQARRLMGPDAVIGVSTHTRAQIEAGCREGADYIAVGPVFGTRTKDTGYAPVGLALVEHAHKQASEAGGVPIVAIGGITLANAAEVIGAGADAVVVISDLLVGNAPAARVREFLRALGEA